MSTPRETCSDCGGATHEIKLIDGAREGDREASYAAVDARPTFWRGHYPTKGRIVAYICNDCGRISQFGVPNE